MDQVETGAAPAAAEPAPIANSEPASFEDTMGAVFDKLNPAREGNGQFKATAAETVAAEVGDEPAEPIEATTPTEEPQEPAKPAIQRPQSWSSDVDELWAKLPPAAQELIAKREGEAHKRITEQGELVKSIEPIQPYLEPLQRASARMGLPPGEGLKLLLAADDYLARDPVSAIQWMAQQAGVDLSRFGQPSNAVPESAEVSALHQKIAHLERQLTDTSTRIQLREQTELQTQQHSLQSLVNDFAKGKDYWPDIETEVVNQIHAIKVASPNLSPKEVLERAHERALKLNDEVRNRLDEARRKADEAKKAADAKRKADEARRLASLNVRSVDGKAPKPARLSLEAEMAEVYDRVSRA